MEKRKYKLIGCFDESPVLIYKIEPHLYVSVNADEFDDSEYERLINVMPNWLSPLRMNGMSITFFEVSPYDERARDILDRYSNYIEEQIRRVKEFHPKPDRGLIREMANIMKHAEPNKPVYW